MELIGWLSAELDREAERSRRALQNVPPGKHDWKPHDKSMIFGYLTNMVATIPTWIAMIINQDELDVAPKGPRHQPAPMNTSRGVPRGARQVGRRSTRALWRRPTRRTSDTNWRLLAAGQVVLETSRQEMITRHHQPLGAPSRPDDGVPPVDGRDSAGAVRAVGRRQAILNLDRAHPHVRRDDGRQPRRVFARGRAGSPGTLHQTP